MYYFRVIAFEALDHGYNKTIIQMKSGSDTIWQLSQQTINNKTVRKIAPPRTSVHWPCRNPKARSSLKQVHDTHRSGNSGQSTASDERRPLDDEEAAMNAARRSPGTTIAGHEVMPVVKLYRRMSGSADGRAYVRS